MGAFGAVGADVDAAAGGEDGCAEASVRVAAPNVLEAAQFDAAELVAGVFVETAWHDFPIPRKDAALPHTPAAVEQFVLQCPLAVGLLRVAAVFRVFGEEGMAVLVIVHLGGFKAHFVNAEFIGKAVHIVDLVLVLAYDQELKNKMRRFGVQRVACRHDVFGAVNDLLQLTVDAVVGIAFLGGAIDGDDESTQAAFNGFARIFGREKMRIGGGHGVDAPLVGHNDQFGKLWVQVGLALKVENEVAQVGRQLIEDGFERVRLELSGGPTEGFQS